MPACFKETYPTTAAILDATELKCEVRSFLSLHSRQYSSYKSHTTHKGLVAIAPNGTLTFNRDLFNGFISGRKITEESGFLGGLDDLPSGKSVIAYKGFDIQDLLAQHNTPLIIRESKSTPLKYEDVIKTQRISLLRVHIERVIRQVKNRFHILDGVISMSLTGSMSQI